VSAATDDAATRLAAAVKGDDGFFSTFFVSSYTPYLVRAAAWLRLTPNLITIGSLAGGIGAAALFAVGSRASLIVGAVVLQLSFTLDVVDGQLARFTGASSAFGAWFDSMVDRTKEYVVYAGLAVGSVRGFHDDVWALAGAALVMQTCRHLLDSSYAAGRSEQSSAAATPSSRGQRLGQGVIRLSGATDRRGAVYWLKRIVVLPIGERLLLICVTAAVFRPRVTFVALLVWGAVALVYIATGRILRSLASGPIAAGAPVLAGYRDDGPLRAVLPTRVGRLPALVLALIAVVPWFVLLGLAGRGGSFVPLGVALAWLLGWGVLSGRGTPVGRLDWLVSPLLQAAEYIGVLRLAAIASDHDVAAGFALAGVIAFRHYDLVYRPVAGEVARVAAWLAGGWELRLVLAYGLAAAGLVEPGDYVFAAALAVLLLSEPVLTWHDRDWRRGAPAIPPAEELH
jgi:phosphatidylglycerophosphate synthase